MTLDQIRAFADHWRPHVTASPEEYVGSAFPALVAATNAIDAVLALHGRVEFDGFDACDYCEMRYPCETVTAITQALDTK